jgi:DNA-binding beta-propeller fold protein YncE
VALAKGPFALVTGRRDPRIYAIDLRAALRASNNNTPNAIVSRSWVNPSRLDGTLFGDPANIVLSDDQRTGFVMNHHGAVVNAEFSQHGGRANVAVMDVRKMIDPHFDNTDGALLHNYDAGWFGGVGLLVTPNLIEGLAFGKGSDGRTYLLSGNAGTEDVAVMDFGRTLAGQKTAEVAPRIPVQTGPFGIRASPNGKFVAVTARESNITGNEGNTISIIDVDKARQGLPGAEAARVQVGVDDPNGQARPFTVSWTPDGQNIVVANFRSNNVSIVNLSLALAHSPGAELARIPLTRSDGIDARPKGTFVTRDGRYAVISGGPNTLGTSTTNATGAMFVIDLPAVAQIAVVTGVGIDPYNLTMADVGDED